MILEWASDQLVEITTTAIDLELVPTDSNEGRLEFQVGIERCETHAARNERLKGKMMDDEIKRVGLESWVPEEMENHLIVNSRLMRMHFVNARISLMLGLSTLLSGKGKRSSDSRGGVSEGLQCKQAPGRTHVGQRQPDQVMAHE